MAKSIKKTYHPSATAKCLNCKSVYNMGSTLENLSLEICANCHPFYTGVEGNIDTAGRIEGFNKKQSMASNGTKKAKTQKVRKLRHTLDSLTAEIGEETATSQTVA